MWGDEDAKDNEENGRQKLDPFNFANFYDERIYVGGVQRYGEGI